jgi:NAD(P)-dependent dehydrogenase (short-subunit alcohol dehydrogenase family)
MRLKNKVAMVTGSAQGNGKAIAIGFAQESAKIAIIDIDEKAANEAASEINKLGAAAIGVAADVGNSDDVEKAVEATMQEFGAIDILVNNAGIFAKHEFLEYEEQDFERVLRTNLIGVFLCSQKVASRMVTGGRGGSIINISSINGGGHSVRPCAAGYASSKGGVSSITKVMAVDLAKHNIRVNAIAPGYFRTAMTDGLFNGKGYLKEILNGIPLGYIASPSELVGPAVFLASEESSYVTGTTLNVDGGWSAYK